MPLNHSGDMSVTCERPATYGHPPGALGRGVGSTHQADLVGEVAGERG